MGKAAIVKPCVILLILAAGTSAQGQVVPLYYDYVESDGQLRGGRIMVDLADPVQRRGYGADLPSGYARGGWPVTTIINNGPTSNRIDLVLLGDGYTAGEMGTYASHVNTVVADFFAEEPIAAYATYFNVHRVDVTSNESGVDEINLNIFRDTTLDMAYGCFNIDRLLCIDTSKAAAAAASAPAWEQILALANSTRYGGAGYPGDNIGTLAGNNSLAVEIALHEFGHAFADLADEYDYGGPTMYTGPEPIEPDVSIYNAAAQISLQEKWYRWMDLPNVHTFEGAYYSQFGVYRPTFNSKMRALNRPFEEVNVEQFVVSMYEIVSPIDDATPTSATPLPASTTLFVTPMQPVDHSLDVQWFMDGVLVPGATGTTFTPSDVTTTLGIHPVSVTVTDNTSRVRDESLRTTWMTKSRQWQVELAGSCAVNTPRTAPSPHDRQKNRYISFNPDNGTSAVALRVDKYFSAGSTGTIGWVNAPGTDGIAKLVSAPVTRVWPEPVVHIGGCAIIPVAAYEVRATCDETLFTPPLTVLTIYEPFPKFWGDTVGSLVAGAWDAPNGVVNVNDFQSVLQRFQGLATGPHITVCDVQAVSSTDPCLNKVVNIADVFLLLKAFQGDVYPFTADPAACPPCP